MGQTDSVKCYGFDVSATARCNHRGGWIAHAEIHHGARLFATCSSDTVQPEWLTQAEATRDGIERGCRFVTRGMGDRPGRSWVAIRMDAERWFFRIEASQETEQIMHDLDLGQYPGASQ